MVWDAINLQFNIFYIEKTVLETDLLELRLLLLELDEEKDIDLFLLLRLLDLWF